MRQRGVIARGQVLAAGGRDNDIQRMVRRRELTRVFEGVYVDHTGALTSEQRAWAAVLYAAPSALAGRDALRAHGVRGFDGEAEQSVQLVVAGTRRVTPQPGIELRRLTTFDTDVQHHLSPPRLRIEPAALDVAAAEPTEDGAVAVLADVCQSRRSTAGRLLTALTGRSRLRHRALLHAILQDVAAGAYSALERRFLIRVERAHGLPTGARQRLVRPGRKPYYRDVSYVGLGTEVELDGRLGHSLARDRWADLERDLIAAVAGSLTVRVGWLQAVEACRLAATLGELLRARGWRGRPRPCGPRCTLI